MLLMSSFEQAWHRLPVVLAVAAACTLAPGEGHTHFALETPASWHTQDSHGSPQKAPPCGNEGGGTDTGAVTAFHAGDTITITINETVYHPGHYRIALSLDGQDALPDPPPVTPGTTPCGSAPIQTPAVFPVLADGVLAHSTPFDSPQSVQVTLPPGVTCERCTLQVIQFMSNHQLNNPGGCFYHHCADISISGELAGAGGQPGSAGEGGQSGGAGSSAGGASGGADADDGASGADDRAGESGSASSPSAGGVGGVSGPNANGDRGPHLGVANGVSSERCIAATPGGATSNLAALAGLLVAAALLRRRRPR